MGFSKRVDVGMEFGVRRVMMIAPTPFFADRGCHVRILEEIKALKKRGIDVFVVTYHIGRDVPYVRIYRTLNVPWYKKLEAGPSIHKPYIDLLLLLKACLVCRKERPDIIHAHLHEGGWVGNFCSKWYNIPLVLDVQGSMTDELVAHNFLGGKKWVMSFFRHIERGIVRKADAIMVSSENTTRILREEFSVDDKRLFFVPDGVDTNFIHPVGDKEALRRRLNLPVDKKIIVYVGVLSGYQGIDMLMEAVANAKDRLKDVLFLMIGYPEDKYRSMAKMYGVDALFSFVGKVDYERIPEYIEAADVGIAPKVSKTEANGKVLNYMAAGLPVVVFDTPVNRFMLGELGIYAPLGDAVGFVSKLIWILDDTEFAKEVGDKLYRRLIERFSWDAISEKIVDVYHKVRRGVKGERSGNDR